MKQFRSFFSAAILLLLAACGQLQTPQGADALPPLEPGLTTAAFSPTSLIVKLASGLDPAAQQAVLDRHGLTETSVIAALRLHVADVPAGSDIDAVIAALEADPDVTRVEREKLRAVEAVPADPRYGDQWALPMIGWDSVYGAVTPGGSVKLALLDTGVDAAHPDLAGRLVPGFSAFGTSPTADPNGHGTAMAGIAAALSNDIGIAGVAYAGVSIMPVQVLDGAGLGQDGDIIAGLVWAADNGARVVLMAFSNPGYSPALQDAIDYAWSKGAVLIAATGNDGLDVATFPAGSAKVMGVSATTADDALWSGSNHGAATFLAAPGVNVLATASGGGTMSITGTSASAAIVAGAAALLRANDAAASNGAIVGRLARNADAVGTQAQTGNGRVNLARAIGDTSTEAVVPGGAAPAEGGPFVGPYVAAARNMTLTFAGTGSGSITITPSTGTVNAPTSCGGTGANASSQTVTSTCTPNISTSDNGATVTYTATPTGGSSFAGWSGQSNLSSSHSCTGTTSPCSAVLSNSPTLTATFNAPVATTTTVTLFAGTNPSTYGTSVTFRATITASPTNPSGVGSVTFWNGATTICSAVPLTGNTADCAVSSLSVGPHNIKAEYSGGTGFSSSMSLNLAHTVIKAGQSIGFGALGNKTFGDAPFSVSASGGASGNPVVFSAGPSTVCTAGGANGSIITIVGAGDCTVHANQAGNANYDPAPQESRSFTVGKAATITTVTVSEATYDGDPHGGTAAVTGAGGLDQTLSVSYEGRNGTVYGPSATAPTNAGDYTASASYAGSANYLSSADSKTFAIDEADQTIVFGALANKTYGDAPFGVSATASSGLAVTFAAAGDCTVAGGTVSITGAGSCTITASQAGNGNYNAAENVEQSFSIDKAPALVELTGLLHTFDGTPRAAIVTTTPSGLTVEVSYDGVVTAPTNAGAYDVVATVVDDNYQGDATDTLTIAKALSTTVVDCPAGPFVYTGSAHEPCTATVTGAGGLDESVAVVYTDNTNAGTAGASATYAGGANHYGSSDSTTFTIDRADADIDVVGFSGTFDGNPHGAGGTATGVQGEDLSSGLGFGETYTDVPGGNAHWTFAGGMNYNDASGTVAITITKAASSTILTCPLTVVYDGTAQTPCTAEVTGVGGLQESVSVSYLDNTNAGTASASAAYAGGVNHDPSSDSTTFEILKAPSITTLDCPVSVTYTGSVLEPCTATVTGAGGLDTSVTVVYTDNTNAGTAGASATYTGGANHDGSSDSTTFTIDKAASETIVTCPISVVYTGAAQTPCTATVTGVGGLDEVVTVTYTDNVNAGTAQASAIFAGGANHEGSSGDATFIIEQAPSTTTVTCPTAVTYSGAAQEPCSAKVVGAGGLDQALDVTYGNNTDAGTATASASFAGDANHTGSSDSTTFTIDKAASSTTVTCEAGPFVYTGSAFEPCTATVTGVGGLNQILAVVYTDNTNAGTAGASATYVGGANHHGSSDSTTFTIGKAPSSTVVTCPASITYTGAALEPCSATATGAGGLNAPVGVTYTDNVNAGTAQASATYAGSANHEGSNGADTFVIDKATTTTTVVCTPASVVYTGSALTPCSASVSGANLVQPLPVSYTNNTDAGTAGASASYAGDANHTGSDASTTFTIQKAASTTTVSCPTSVTYNGAAQIPCSATATGAGGLSATLEVSHGNNLNAGIATASASYAGDANHEASNGSTNFTIAKAPSTTTITCPTSLVFTGAPLMPCSATVAGVGGVTGSATIAYVSNTAVGTATATATYDGDANHSGSSASTTFGILAWTLQGFYAPVGTGNTQTLAPASALPNSTTVWNTAKAGSTIPLKFNVFAGGVERTSVADIRSFSAAQVNCPGTAVIEDPVDFVITGNTTLVYTDGQFHQNWKTPKVSRETCYRVVVTAQDGSMLVSFFRLR